MLKRLCIFLLVMVPVLLNAEIYLLKIHGPIETITEEYIVENLNKIKNEELPDAQLVVLLLDTPGGIDTSMRNIIKATQDFPIPVAAFVSPKGARAASAGFFITIAADIAAMAPGTNMGAAHPVAMGGQKIDETMNEKITNDAVSYVKSLAKSRNRNEEWAALAVEKSKSYTAQECLDNNLIDYMADHLQDLLKKLDGKTVTMANGKTITLNLAKEKTISVEMTYRQKFLKTITNPNLAYFLLIFGLVGLYLEFSHPGMIIPGVLGGICLLLAFMALQILPVNYVGLLLLALAVGFFIAEVKIQGFGAFGVGGIIAFVLGSIILIDSPIPEMRPDMSLIIGAAVIFGAIFMFLTYKVIQAMKPRVTTGSEGLLGERGTAKAEVTATSGRVFVHGEWWNAVLADPNDSPIQPDSPITVMGRENFVLKVK